MAAHTHTRTQGQDAFENCRLLCVSLAVLTTIDDNLFIMI